MNIINILSNWNIQSEEIKQIHPNAWTIDNKYVLKSGENRSEMGRNITVMKKLKEYNTPVAEIVKTKVGKELFLVDDCCFLLTKKIKGNHIVDIFDKNYKHISRQCGEIIGKLHNVFQIVQANVACCENDLFDEMNGWVKQYFEDGNIYVDKQEFANILALLGERYNELPRQLIHRDMHMGNLLFSNGVLSGYIDFDLTQINIRIFDICYFILGLMADANIGDEKNKKQIETVKSTIGGYTSIIRLTDAEKYCAIYVMECIELLFVAYLGHNGDDKLAQNAYDLFLWLRENETEITSCFNGI